MEDVVLNRVGILGFFVLNRVSFRLLAAPLLKHRSSALPPPSGSKRETYIELNVLKLRSGGGGAEK